MNIGQESRILLCNLPAASVRQAGVRQTKKTEHGPWPVLSSNLSHNTKKTATEEKIPTAFHASRDLALPCLFLNPDKPGEAFMTTLHPVRCR